MQRKNDSPSSLRNRHLPSLPIRSKRRSRFARRGPARPARAAKKYGPGVTDSEIKLDNTGPYSGPLSNASPLPISMAAYFKVINDQGGVNGRKITFISYDDGYSPPKTVEMTRKLIESDEVFFLAGSVGTPTNTAIWHYMNRDRPGSEFSTELSTDLLDNIDGLLTVARRIFRVAQSSDD
jgi:hypothetical protein